MTTAVSFLNLIFVGFVSLFAPVNPIGTALIVDPLLRGLGPADRKAAAIKISFYCFTICVCTLFIGSWLFRLFGISLPVVQVAGGILICRMGWQLLSTGENGQGSNGASRQEASRADAESLLFYPLAFPMTTGAGTISVLLTLSAHGHSHDEIQYLMNLLALFVAVFLMCIAIFLSYSFTPALLKKIGDRGEQIVNRLCAFLVFCVGLQIAAGGLTTLIRKG